MAKNIEIYRDIYLKVISPDFEKLSNAEKGKLSNKLHNELCEKIESEIINNEGSMKDLFFNRYSYIVSILETRHKIKPYNDIEFSRRIGELWESFCKLSLNNPFSTIRTIKPVELSLFYKKLKNDLSFIEKKENETFNLLKDLLGDINLTLDYHGKNNNQELVIDFKSGFGSNEKGNTQRILQVGKIYKYINKEVDLNIIVRQANENNNYLKKIEGSGIWNVLKGEEGYKFLGKISGCDINTFVKNDINFERDFDSDIYKDIGGYVTNRDRYLNWYS